MFHSWRNLMLYYCICVGHNFPLFLSVMELTSWCQYTLSLSGCNEGTCKPSSQTLNKPHPSLHQLNLLCTQWLCSTDHTLQAPPLVLLKAVCSCDEASFLVCSMARIFYIYIYIYYFFSPAVRRAINVLNVSTCI